MKYLLVTALVLVMFWVWRNNRKLDKQATKNHPPSTPAGSHPAHKPIDMVACHLCHVHLPQSDALKGAGGVYYCDAHENNAGGGR